MIFFVLALRLANIPVFWLKSARTACDSRISWWPKRKHWRAYRTTARSHLLQTGKYQEVFLGLLHEVEAALPACAVGHQARSFSSNSSSSLRPARFRSVSPPHSSEETKVLLIHLSAMAVVMTRHPPCSELACPTVPGHLLRSRRGVLAGSTAKVIIAQPSRAQIRQVSHHVYQISRVRKYLDLQWCVQN